MNPAATLRKSLTASPMMAAAAYAALVIVLVGMTVSSLVDIFSQRASVAASEAMLAQLEGRKVSAPGGRSGDAGMPSGSAFLEGATVTVAGAALLQRVAGAVTKHGGNVLSSQLDVQGTQAKAGFVSMVANCELDQAALQPLLYDLEAGMPFLFIDQLDIQVSTTASAPEGKLRFLLGVSGQWQGTK
jgi:general secretion pathway protein M